MDVFDQHKRSDIMRRIGSKETEPEKILRKKLFRLGLRYRKNNVNLPGKPDIVFSRNRLAVFVHGCFWHSHEGCLRAFKPKSNLEYWLPKLERNKTRDKEVEEKLIDAGWSVFIAWECEIKRNPDKVAAEIMRKLKDSGENEK